jgi:MFS family permease
MTSSTSSPTLAQDARVITLVGVAHGVSHFYHLIVAALFPWLKEAFQLSYAELGLLMSGFFVVSGIGQAMAGFVVDRFGARRVLFAGMAMLGLSSLVLALAPNYAMLMAGSMLAGLGNSVFHPADYTILNHSVSRERMAHAFSVHGITGNLGWAAAPVLLAGVASISDWRTALAVATVIPFAVLAVLVHQRDCLKHEMQAPLAGKAEGSFDFLRLPAVWMSFGFFFFTAIALGGIQSFASTGLVSLYGMSLATATSAYTAYMLASAGGMVAGGFLAQRARSHDRTIAVAFTFAALLGAVLALAIVPAWMAVVLMALVGLASGVAGPSRDLLVRSAAPANATGRVFGVVYSGLDSGLAIGPLVFGALMDAHQPAWIFYAVALFQLLAIFTAVGVTVKSAAPLTPAKA